MIRFLHSGASGDVIASLSLVKQLCDKYNDQAVIVLDVTGGVSANDERLNGIIRAQTKNRGYNFTRKNCDFIKPLLEYQFYIAGVEIWDNPGGIPPLTI